MTSSEVVFMNTDSGISVSAYKSVRESGKVDFENITYKCVVCLLEFLLSCTQAECGFKRSGVKTEVFLLELGN